MSKILFLFLIIVISTAITSCGSIVPKQPNITHETPLDIPETKGTVRIPLEINLKPYFELADKSIDYTFQGKEEQCDGVSFQYYFKRKPLEFNGSKQTLGYKINGEYNIRANYCAQCSSAFGSEPFCLTPRIYVSCGVGEPLRKIEINFESDLEIEPNYRIKSKTRLKNVETINPCQFTFLNYDASKLIEKEMGAYLKTMEKEIDDQIKQVDIKTPISEAWLALQQAIPVPDFGYLYFNPKAIEIEPITFFKETAKVFVNMELSPTISTNEMHIEKIPLPNIKNIKTSENFQIPVLTLASFDSINSVLKKEIVGIEIPFKKKKIIVTEGEILGPVDTKLLFKIKFIGSKKGTLYLLGTPTFDEQKKEISFPDLLFDIRTKDAVLKSAKWLFDKKLTDALRAKAKYQMDTELEKIRVDVAKQLNSTIEISKTQKVKLTGDLIHLNLSKIEIGATDIRVIINLIGNLSLKL